MYVLEYFARLWQKTHRRLNQVCKLVQTDLQLHRVEKLRRPWLQENFNQYDNSSQLKQLTTDTKQ